MKKYIGKREFVSGTDMGETYASLAAADEKAALCLEREKLYNEAVYMHIQSMEKKIKGYLCRKIDASNPYFSQKLRDIGHSLDESIDFLIEILAGNDDLLKEQLSHQLKTNVFGDIRFSRLYNECRYPHYNYQKNDFSVLRINKEDCQKISGMNSALDHFIASFDRL